MDGEETTPRRATLAKTRAPRDGRTVGVDKRSKRAPRLQVAGRPAGRQTCGQAVECISIVLDGLTSHNVFERQFDALASPQ